MARKIMKNARKWSLGMGAALLALVIAWGAIASECRTCRAIPLNATGPGGATVDLQRECCSVAAEPYAIRGIVYDAEGQGMSGVAVELDRAEGLAAKVNTSRNRLLVAITDKQGCFCLNPAREGLFTLVISDMQHCPVWIQNVASGAQGVAVRLDRVPSIVGQVMIEHHGRCIPLAGIEVRAQLDDMSSPIPIVLASDRVTTTDADGRFRFRGLGAQLRDGQALTPCQALSPTLTWRIECGPVGDCVTVRPTDREVDVKLVLSKDDGAVDGMPRLVSCTHTIGRMSPSPAGY
jgi:hypothetical protein